MFLKAYPVFAALQCSDLKLANIFMNSHKCYFAVLSPLTEAEREIIATFVSHRNNCKFCAGSHGAAAKVLLGDDAKLMDDVLNDYQTADISDKLKALLNIAGKVQILGKEVKQQDIDLARSAGANDLDIHDTVLIAATFSMYNRYVDGLGTLTPSEPGDYLEMGKRLRKKVMQHLNQYTNHNKLPTNNYYLVNFLYGAYRFKKW